MVEPESIRHLLAKVERLEKKLVQLQSTAGLAEPIATVFTWEELRALDALGGGWIYYLQISRYVKIGKTSKLADRISSAATFSPFPVWMVGLERGSHSLEQARHQQFNESRLLRREDQQGSAAWRDKVGEWFRPTPHLIGHVQGLERPIYNDSAAAVSGAPP